MFMIISGDFSKGAYLQDELFSPKKRIIETKVLKTTVTHLCNAEKIRLLSSDEIKELIYDANCDVLLSKYLEECLTSVKNACFEYRFSNGKSFKAIADTQTFREIQKSGEKKMPENKLSKTNSNIGCIVGMVMSAMLLVIIVKGCMEDYSSNARIAAQEDAPIASFAAYGISPAQEQSARNALNKIGIDKITRIEKEADGEYTFYYGKEEPPVWLTFKGTKVKTIDLTVKVKHLREDRLVDVPGKTLYKNGKAIWKVQDFVFMEGESRAMYRNDVQEYVKSILKVPESAKFPDCFIDCSGWAMSKDKGIVIVQSYVDSRNGLGLTSRMFFEAQYKNGRIISFRHWN